MYVKHKSAIWLATLTLAGKISSAQALFFWTDCYATAVKTLVEIPWERIEKIPIHLHRVRTTVFDILCRSDVPKFTVFV
jgi:hypothetical protein